MIPRSQHTTLELARSLATSWCVKRPYLLGSSIVIPATPSSFDRMTNQEGEA
jgi:hypothetical protein